jgi:hypothetical protein
LGGTFITHGEVRKAYKILVVNPEGKRLLGMPRSGWENNFQVQGEHKRTLHFQNDTENKSGVL